STLIVAESYAARISAWTIAPDGSLSDRRTFAQFGDAPDYLDIDRGNRELAAVPDGICLDADGRLWVADARGHGVWLVDDGGHVADFIDTAPLATFAVALGGADGRTLYICAAPPHGSFDPETENLSVLLSTRVRVGAA